MAYPDKKLELITNGGQCRFTNTDDFFSTVQNVSGQNLDWFKHIYFKNASLPELSILENEQGTLLKWIVKNNMDFPMPLEIKTKDGISKIVFKDGIAQLNLDLKDIIEIDPNKWVLYTKKE